VVKALQVILCKVDVKIRTQNHSDIVKRRLVEITKVHGTVINELLILDMKVGKDRLQLVFSS